MVPNDAAEYLAGGDVEGGYRDSRWSVWILVILLVELHTRK